MSATYFSRINRTVLRLTLCSLVLFLAPPANAADPFECASSWDNIGTESNPLYVDDPNPPPLPGTPELTIDGIKRFVDENGISSVEGLLNTECNPSPAFI